VSRLILLIPILFTLACSGTADAGGCPPRIESVRDCVAAAVRPVAPGHTLPAQSAAAAVALYIDRSGSMNGYLDAENSDSVRNVHASGANLRTTLTRLLAVGGERTQVYGFGERAAPIPAMAQTAVLRQLFSQSFYNENDTRTEDVLALVRADSARSSVHLIVTDGRRGSGEAAIAQYQRLGEVASWWTSRDGVFAIAASLSPFQQVREDRAGCWQSDPSAGGRCPLYVFAFIPASAAERTLSILDEVSERLYAYPPPSDDRVRASHAVAAREGNGAVAVLRGQPLVLGFRSQAAQNQPVSADVNLTLHLDQSTARFALDDSLAWGLERATLVRQEPQWTEAGDLADDWVQPETVRRGPGATLVVPLKVRTYAGLAPTLYRLRISSTGMPGWMRDYEAVQQRDSLRTYGLTTLFTQMQPRPALLTGTFVTVY
jgi:hypothetical protein